MKPGMKRIGRAVALGLVVFAACRGGDKSSTKVAEPAASAPTVGSGSSAATPTAPTEPAAKASDPALQNIAPKELATKWLRALAANDKAFLAERTAVPFAQKWFANGEIGCQSAATNEDELHMLIGCIQRNTYVLETITEGFKDKVSRELMDISLDPNAEVNRGGFVLEKGALLQRFAPADVKTIRDAPRDHLVSFLIPDSDEGNLVVFVAIKGGKVTHAFLPEMSSVE
jgi:hypothetical protein